MFSYILSIFIGHTKRIKLNRSYLMIYDALWEDTPEHMRNLESAPPLMIESSFHQSAHI